MRAALLALVLAGAAGAEDSRAFVETDVAREALWVGESVRVTLRVGVDRAFFEKSAVQMFQQRLDIPVHVEAPWLVELRAPTGTTLSLALNDAIVQAVQRPNRGVFAVLEVSGTLRPDSPGEFELAAPRLRYAYATRFRENLVYGRMPVDRREGSAVGRRVVLDVRPLPPAPGGFAGAIGRFRVRADARSREVEAGEVFELTLTVTGRGNLDRIEAPRLALPGFHVYGALRRAAGAFAYDVAAVEAVDAIPPIPFVAFDPATGAYATVTTEAIPLVVRGAPGPPSVPPPSSVPAWPWLVVPVLAVALALRFARTRRRETPPDAAARFRAHADEDLAGALAEYLAVRLSCPAAAVIGPGLAERLVAAGAKEAAARRAAGLMERLVGERYGGAPDAGARAAAEALVAELEATA